MDRKELRSLMRRYWRIVLIMEFYNFLNGLIGHYLHLKRYPQKPSWKATRDVAMRAWHLIVEQYWPADLNVPVREVRAALVEEFGAAPIISDIVIMK